MATLRIQKDYNVILTTFLKYLPSRLLVILNSLIIVPFFAYILSAKEMGIYQISIGVLNLLCTCSTDWISKSALRFYEKYKINDKLEEFYSNVILISLVVYGLILVIYLLFGNEISQKFFVSKDILILTLILIIPCGVRQFLYQMLRVLNKPFLYTFSIIIYQFTHLLLFLILFNILNNNVIAILTSMTIAMVIIDFYILKKINLKTKLKLKFDTEFINEALKYSLPMVITNTSIWTLLHINKFIFQRNEMFQYTAEAGIAWLYTSYILTPLLSAFLFAVFPIIIKRYEHRYSIQNITTCTIRLYCILFIPFVSTFIYFAKEISDTMFHYKYNNLSIILPFFAATIFLHELMKILNIKYHLKNKTYIEMLISVFAGIICVYLNFILIPEYNLLGAGIAMISSISLMIMLHSLIRFKSLNYIFPKKIFKTVAYTVLTGIIIYYAFRFADILHPIIKVCSFIAVYYYAVWTFKNRILD